MTVSARDTLIPIQRLHNIIIILDISSSNVMGAWRHIIHIQHHSLYRVTTVVIIKRCESALSRHYSQYGIAFQLSIERSCLLREINNEFTQEKSIFNK